MKKLNQSLVFSSIFQINHVQNKNCLTRQNLALYDTKIKTHGRHLTYLNIKFKKIANTAYVTYYPKSALEGKSLTRLIGHLNVLLNLDQFR